MNDSRAFVGPSTAVDEITRAIYLDMPREQIVVLQALLELYEGVATMRTVDAKKGVVCLLTTSTMLDDCWLVLNGVRDLIHWRTLDYDKDPLGRDLDTSGS